MSEWEEFTGSDEQIGTYPARSIRLSRLRWNYANKMD